MTVAADGKHIYVVCYPGGAGGSFIASVLQHVLFNLNFSIDPQHGHCHINSVISFPNIFHGPTIESFQEEIYNIYHMDYAAGPVYNGHYRNLVGIQDAITTQLGYESAERIKFIKISTDAACEDHAIFAAGMLRKKVNSFADQSIDDFIAQTAQYLKSWYWIENYYTKAHTIDLCISDVFGKNLATKKFQTFLNSEQIIQFDECQRQYLLIQWHLHPDLMALLN